MIQQLTIFGVGLIGGSLGLALKKQQYCGRIVGCSRHESNLDLAIELGAIDVKCLDPAEAVRDADVVLLAVPVGAMQGVLEQIVGHLKPSAIITDAGSSKQSVLAAAERVFGAVPANFIPAHPIAGREKSGVAAAVADLYVGHKVIVCPQDQSDPEAVNQVSKMWQIAGATVELLDAQQHDHVLAATSHLPHVLAYSLVNTISDTEFVDEIFRYAAGGFRDLSRTASSDPVMWRDICLENRDAILVMLDQYQANLADLKQMIQTSDRDGLQAAFERAKTTRDSNVSG